MRPISPQFSADIYTIKLKWDQTCELLYGRTKYDFTSGSLVFIAPGQILGWDKSTGEIESNGIMLMIHQDYLRGYEIEKRFKKAPFFSYALHEALHLSPREEDIIKQIVGSINDEYLGNPDAHSKEIILAHLDALLRYADRFYSRQFINHKEINTHIASRFQGVLADYFESGTFKEKGLPNIDMVAEQLALSPRYLSDALIAETGKTAMEHLHLYLVEEPKSLLLTPSITISEVAYQLGFEYPQYFFRMFKKKTGISPKVPKNIRI
jgi:AraC-like DNA-binding protein